MSAKALKWGLAIGPLNLIWLSMAYYLGLQTNGIWIFQIFMLIWLGLTITGFVVDLRGLKRHFPRMTYLQERCAGLLAALAPAVVAVIAQVGYFTVVHPAWPDDMVQQTREYFEKQGLSPAEVEEQVVLARQCFELTNYATSSAITAAILGTVVSAIIMLFLKKPTAETVNTCTPVT